MNTEEKQSVLVLAITWSLIKNHTHTHIYIYIYIYIYMTGVKIWRRPGTIIKISINTENSVRVLRKLSNTRFSMRTAKLYQCENSIYNIAPSILHQKLQIISPFIWWLSKNDQWNEDEKLIIKNKQTSVSF